MINIYIQTYLCNETTFSKESCLTFLCCVPFKITNAIYLISSRVAKEIAFNLFSDGGDEAKLNETLGQGKMKVLLS
jgi:hypothetical protein